MIWLSARSVRTSEHTLLSLRSSRRAQAAERSEGTRSARGAQRFECALAWIAVGYATTARLKVAQRVACLAPHPPVRDADFVAKPGKTLLELDPLDGVQGRLVDGPWGNHRRAAI